MHPRRASRPLLAAPVRPPSLVLGVAGCGDDDEPTATGDGGTTTTDGGSTGGDDYGGTTGGGTDGEAPAGTIVAADFSLTDVTVAPGEADRAAERGRRSPTPPPSDEEGLFDLGGGRAARPPSRAPLPIEPGDYAFHCEIHPTMTATLTVEG